MPAKPGPVVTRVQGNVGQQYTHTPAPTSTSPAPADTALTQQQPSQAPLDDRAPQFPEPTVSASGDPGSVERSAGARISLEAQRAMSQLAAQRTALVHALQQRANQASLAFAPLEGEDDGSSVMPPARDDQRQVPGEEVVWYSRLQGFLRTWLNQFVSKLNIYEGLL